MKVLWKCCIRALKENRGRTIVTIIGVAMATALITALACMGSSVVESMIRQTQKENGVAEALFQGVDYDDLKYFQNNQSLERIWMAKRLGYSLEEGRRNGYDISYYVDVCAAEPDWYRAQGIRLATGRFPEKEDEIMLSRAIRSDLGRDVKIGDRITLKLGKRVADGQEVEIGVGFQENETIDDCTEKTFEIVGFWDQDYVSSYFGSRRGNNPSRSGNRNFVVAYTFFDRERPTPGCYDVCACYTYDGLAKRHEVNQAILGVSWELYEKVYLKNRNVYEEEKYQISRRVKRFSPHSALAELEEFSRLQMSQSTYGTIALAEIFFMMIVLAGVFCIDNSFDISLNERMRYYGILSSVGTTKKQRRMLVWLEALVIGALGVPLGILCGVGVTWGLVQGTNLFLREYVKSSDFVMVFQAAWWAIVIAVIQAIVMVLFSATEAAVRASRISPINAIRSNELVKSKGKAKKTPKLLKKLFGVGGSVAWQNFKRSKMKYRATVTSIAISVAIFLGMNFIPLVYEASKKEIIANNDHSDYQISVSIENKDGYEKLLEIAKWDGVVKYMIERDLLILDAQYSEDPAVREKFKGICVKAVDEEFFQRLCMENGIDPGEAKGKGVASAAFSNILRTDQVSGNYRTTEDRKEQLPGTPVTVKIAGAVRGNEDAESTMDELPLIYVGQSFVEQNGFLFSGEARGYYVCEDANAMINAILQENILNCMVDNCDEAYQEMLLTRTIIGVVVVGFIIVFTLIGITNVINANSFNMEQRSPEFAKLRAVGMTKKQFREMFWMEGTFVIAKGLFYGTLAGCLISYALYRFWWEANLKQFEFAFRIPGEKIVTSAIIVSALIFMITLKYGKKAESKNIIETIRNENV